VTLAETLVTPTETFVHSGEATVKSTKSAAVETPTPAAMRPSVGKIWLTERGGAQHSSCDGQNPSVLRPGFNFA
jgi:hypothetical protein